MTNNYTIDNIKILTDIQHLRERASMYVGVLDNPYQIFAEILDNAIDESAVVKNNKITVKINTKDNSYYIADTGRGIPIGMKKDKYGGMREVVDILVTTTNAGGKFDDDGAYIFSVGLHGIGSTATNALSKYFQISTTVGNENRTFAYSRGEQINKLKYPKLIGKQGVQVIFIPDEQIFETTIIPRDLIIHKCRIANAFGINIRLFFDSEEIELATDGLISLIPTDTELSVYHTFPQISTSKNNLDECMVVLLQYTSDTKDKYFGYTNLAYNSVGGTHINYIQKVIPDAWKEYIRVSKIKLDTELKSSDFLVGLRCVCAVFLKHPEFSAQTKERLSVKKDVMIQFTQPVIKQLVATFKLYDKQSKALLKRFEEYRISQNKLLSRKEISSWLIVNKDNNNNIRRRSNVPGLIECTQTKLDNTELYLCEGLSAAGAVTRTRNKNLQACLPLRGKVLNVTGLSVTEAVKSQVIRNITNAVGAGIGNSCDSDKRRYDRIMIATDADADGSHICCLLLSTFVNLLPDIVKNGCLYVVVPPLYGWSDKTGKHYTNDLKDIPKNCRYSRYKGLGEFNDDEYKYCIMNPKTRITYQVEYPDNLDEFNLILGTSQGKASIMKELGLIRYE